MKKTLIALLALGGVAMADETYTQLKDLPGVNYFSGDPYTLTLDFGTTVNINGYTSVPILTLGTNCHIFSQAGSYIGLSINGTSVDGQLTGGYTATSYDVVAGTTQGWFADNGVSGQTLTITGIKGEGETGDSTVLTFVKGDVTKTLTFNSLLNVNEMSLNTGRLTNASVTSYVPEPATATLSLLALAGLAARRKRK